VEKVWTAGALIYGDKWSLKHGEVPTGEWLNVFMSFDDEQILIGIERMKDEAETKIAERREAWPPTVFEFACYCKTRESNSLYFPDEHKALPKPRADKKAANKQMQAIRKKLGQSI